MHVNLRSDSYKNIPYLLRLCDSIACRSHVTSHHRSPPLRDDDSMGISLRFDQYHRSPHRWKPLLNWMCS